MNSHPANQDDTHGGSHNGHNGHNGQGGHTGHGGYFDLHAAARRIVAAGGFEIDLAPDAEGQANHIDGPAAMPTSGARDLRGQPWSSIDNAESRDLDQIEIAEKLADGSIKIVVAIADVDALVPKGS